MTELIQKKIKRSAGLMGHHEAFLEREKLENAKKRHADIDKNKDFSVSRM